MEVDISGNLSTPILLWWYLAPSLWDVPQPVTQPVINWMSAMHIYFTSKPERISIWVRGKSQAANHQQLSATSTNQADICGLSNKKHFFLPTLISTSPVPAFISKGLALYLLQKTLPDFFSCSWFWGWSLKSEYVTEILTCLLQAACKVRDGANYLGDGKSLSLVLSDELIQERFFIMLYSFCKPS